MECVLPFFELLLGDDDVILLPRLPVGVAEQRPQLIEGFLFAVEVEGADHWPSERGLPRLYRPYLHWELEVWIVHIELEIDLVAGGENIAEVEVRFQECFMYLEDGIHGQIEAGCALKNRIFASIVLAFQTVMDLQTAGHACQQVSISLSAYACETLTAGSDLLGNGAAPVG
jgi:hypothetical protein